MSTSIRRRHRLAAILAAASIGAAGILPLADAARATEDFAITRLAGDDRVATAAAIALDTFPVASGGAATAVLASAANFPDALAGNYTAGLLGAPLLLTAPDRLSAVTRSTLSSLGVDDVVVLGGPAAIAPAVESDVRGMGLRVSRIGGADRFDTAAQLARIAGAGAIGRDGSGRRTAVLSSGLNFPDALAAGPLVYREHFPLLLTGSGALPAATRQVIVDLDIDHVIVTGGPAAVPTSVDAELAGAGVADVQRIEGDTRYTTALDLAAEAGAVFGFQATHLNFATGENFPDALAGGPHGGRELAPVLLVPPSTTDGGFVAVCNTLEVLGPVVASGHAFGGPAAIPDAIVTALDDCGTPPELATLQGQLVRVEPGINQYTFVDQTETVRTIVYDDQDTFRVDGVDVSVAIFEANLSPGDDIRHADDPTAADADVHELTTRTVTNGLVGNVSVADNRLAIINPVTGDVVGGPFLWNDGADEFVVGGTGTSAAAFEGAVNEGDTVNVTLSGTDPIRLALTNAELSGTVSSRSAPDANFAAFSVDNVFGDEAENGQDAVYVAEAAPDAGTAERYVVDSLPTATFSQFAVTLSVGDLVAVRREVVSGTPTETFTLTNVSPPAISGQVTSFINTAEDPNGADPSGDRFAVVPAAGGYQTVDYTSTPALTGFRIGATTVDEATFEAALSAGDTVVFQPGSTSPAVTETLTLTNAALQGQLYAINTGADLYGVYAADKQTLLALVGYTLAGNPPLTNQYFFNGDQLPLAQWEAAAAQVNVATSDLDDPVAIEVTGSFRNHRLSSLDPISP